VVAVIGGPARAAATLPHWIAAVDRFPGQVVRFIGAHGWQIAAAAMFTAAACAAGEAWRRRRAEAALADRFAVELVPAVTFDPTPSAVDWFAGQVASVRVAAGAVPERAAAARLRIVTLEGKVRMQLEGPSRAASILRMPGYEQVEIVTADARTHKAPRIRFEGVPPVAGRRRNRGGAR
jgi:hypothetical protein